MNEAFNEGAGSLDVGSGLTPSPARVNALSGGKYIQLARYLENQDADEFEMSLFEIAAVIGKPLPKSAQLPGWWKTGGSSRRPHHVALSTSGFLATLTEEQRVRFRRTEAIRREREGYGKYVYLPGGARRPRYTAIDPAESADRCTCGKPACPRNRLLPLREHIASLYRLLAALAYDGLEPSARLHADDAQDTAQSTAGVSCGNWESVLFPLLLAGSIQDVEADTGYADNPMTFALCESSIDFVDAHSEMVSKYVAAASVFSFLWNAYEAAVAATATDELRGLLKDGQLGVRGRRLLEARPDLSTHFRGISELVRLAIRWCELGGRFSHRLRRIQARFTERNLVLAAELCREFRNFVFHGEDQVPDHPDWGERFAYARFYRFYVLGRLLLYAIQALAWTSIRPDADSIEWGYDEFGDHQMRDPRELLTAVQFA